MTKKAKVTGIDHNVPLVSTLPRACGLFPHQHSEQQSLDLWVRQHLLIQQNVGLWYRHLAKVRVSNSLCLCDYNTEDWHKRCKTNCIISDVKEMSGLHSHLSHSHSLLRVSSWEGWSYPTPSLVSLVLLSPIWDDQSSSWCLTNTDNRYIYNLEFQHMDFRSTCNVHSGGISHTQELLSVGLWGLTHVQAHGLAGSWANLAHCGVVMGWEVALWNLRWSPWLSLSQCSEVDQRSGKRRQPDNSLET